MTQAELARRIGVSQGAVSMIENSERKPSIEILMRIASELGASLDELVSEEEGMT